MHVIHVLVRMKQRQMLQPRPKAIYRRHNCALPQGLVDCQWHGFSLHATDHGTWQ